MKGRLPDGATFTVRYLAAVKRWAGELVVEGARFEGDAPGVFQLLHQLDDQFRAWKLARAGSPPVGSDVTGVEPRSEQM